MRLSTDVLFTYLVGWLVGWLGCDLPVLYRTVSSLEGRKGGRKGWGRSSFRYGSYPGLRVLDCPPRPQNCRPVATVVVGRSVVSTWGGRKCLVGELVG